MRTFIYKILREENFLSLAGNVVIALLGIGGFAILARTLSKELFGQWVLFIAGASLLEMLRFGITSIGLIRFLPGVNKLERKALLGANVAIGLATSLAIAVLVFTMNLIFDNAISLSAFALFFDYYPLLILANLPWNNAICILQSQLDFGRILLIRSVNSGLFFLCLLFHWGVLAFSLNQLVYCLLAVNVITSFFTLWKGWDQITSIIYTTKAATKKLLNFGKYTTFTLIGTNLLRNADTFIISLSPLGPGAVALYSIPLKLTELQQIPLRSFAATAFPKMSRASNAADLEQLRSLFYKYSGALTILFTVGSLLTFLFADLLVLVLSGNQYAGTDPVTGFNAADILRVFAIYGLLLPLDRMTGIGLDSLNKPNINAFKVLIMVACNIIGDLVAVFVFESLILVAVSSIAFTGAGIWIGFVFMNKAVGLSFKRIFKEGLNFYKESWRQFIAIRKVSKVKPLNGELQ